MPSPQAHSLATLVLWLLAPLTFFALLFIVAPYGRHARGGFGPALPDRLGWFLMESPSFFGFAFLYSRGANWSNAAPLALAALWLLHYGQRTLIYPLRLRTCGKQMPLLIAASAIAFNLVNITANAPQISQYGSYPNSWLGSFRFLAGALFFLGGFALNLDADRRLFALRAPGESGYKIPRGGLYRWVTCPNYLGEMIEWFGWALATWSLAGLGFAVYTVANLLPRALANHRWYRERFPDYPRERRALIPFIL